MITDKPITVLCLIEKAGGGGRIKCTKWEIIKISKNSGELLLGHSLIIVEGLRFFLTKDCNLTPPLSFTISHKRVLHVTSYNILYLPRFIYFLCFSHLKAPQILPQNKYKRVIETVVI